MIRNGVKSRIALTHTCGLEPGAIPEPIEITFDFNKEPSTVVIGGGLYDKYKALEYVKKPKPKPKPKY